MNRKLLSIFLTIGMAVPNFAVNTFADEQISIKSEKQNIPITNLSDEELKKCESAGVHKKDWAQRLQWFEGKIINYYKGLNKKNILIVGNQKFFDTFKASAQKYGLGANFFHETSASSLKSLPYDLVIDTQYQPNYFKKIYGGLCVSSFRNVYSEILYDETLTFLEKNGVKYYFFESPIPKKIKNLSEIDKKFLNKGNGDLVQGQTLEDLLSLLYKDNIECYRFMKENYLSKYRLKSNGRCKVLSDFKSDVYNVTNGKRYTAFSPNIPVKNRIWVHGPCIVGGFCVSDKYTIPSYVQNLTNNKGKSYSLVNCGTGGGPDLINDFEYILDGDFNKGDLIVEINTTDENLNRAFQNHNINKYETSHLFNRPHDHGKWLINDGAFHINHIGNEVIANYIYDVIEPDLNNDNMTEPPETIKYQFESELDTFLDDNPDFKNYLNELKSIKENSNVNGKVGSIVMNCNPFTLGHRYLIEQAANQVDHLYIFVVEEDKSVFPFKDRMELVKKGIADLKDKVTVLPSGKWIISLLTFPEYFVKDDKQEDTIDPSKDVRLFGKYICPALGINKRFAGEEPFDLVTRQYNDTMRRELPLLGVDFQEIPRKSVEGDDVISATKVRKALKASDFERLKKYVPKTTLDYLQENNERIVSAINSKYSY